MIIYSLMSPSVAQTVTPNKSATDQLFEAAFSYYVVARVCKDSNMIKLSERVLIRVINWNEFKKYKLNSIDSFLKNKDSLLQEGEKRYKNELLVSCGQARDIITQLDDLTKQFP